MCGFCGVMTLDGSPVEVGTLRRMTATLTHRGPDGEGWYCSPQTEGVQVGLGHRRLKVIDLTEASAQPMANDDQTLWLVFNGEIYNFRELRASLEMQGVRFRTSSDTEVILRLYEAEGERCLSQLDGMFALAIWDARRRWLLLARDRVGKKPLFYHASRTLFAFASEAKALFQHERIAPDIDTASLPAFFLYGYVPTPGTVYRHLQQLPPGHWLRVDHRGEVRLESYWDFAVASRSDGPPPSTVEAASRVRELLTAAVRKRLVADVPLGAFLSGGLDSSIIVALMAQCTDQPVRTFSIGFAGDPRFNETAYARAVSKHFNTTHTEFVVDPSAVELVERLVWHHDGPFADSSAIPTYLLARLTRSHVTVALNGDGGDEVFAGYLRFSAALLSERIPLWMRHAAARCLSRLPEWGAHRSVFRNLQKFAGSASLPFVERFCRWTCVFYEDLPQLLPDWQDRGATPEPLSLIEPHLQGSAGASPLSRLLYLNLKTYLLDDLLVKMDRSTMAHGLEARSPFLDRDLMEYVLALPDSMKLQWGRTKVILRDAFRDVLPAAILRRGKMGFGVPLRTWLKGELRAYVHDLLLASDARSRPYVNQDYVRQLFLAHVSGRSDHSHRLWTLLTFEVWLRNLSRWSAHRELEEVESIR